jgi:hypothetical protein
MGAAPSLPVPQERPLAQLRGKRVILVLNAAAAAPLTAAALDIVADPGSIAPVLPAAAVPGGPDIGARRSLPPAQPPALRGSVVPVPDPLQPLFAGGGSGGRVLEQLLREAVANLGTSTALAAAQPAGSQLDQQQMQLPLAVSPDLDFGTLAVSTLTAGDLVEAATSAAEGLPQKHGAGGMAHGGAGSLLGLLHLSAAVQQTQQQQAATPAAASALPVLHFRQLLVENCSSSDEVWLLGGVAAPSFPHTLAACDDAQLFWRDGEQAALLLTLSSVYKWQGRLCPRGLKLHQRMLPCIDCAGHKAVRLGPKQQHTISVALSSADCAARRQEKGILQQLLLLVFAVAPHSRTAAVLAQVEGAAVADFLPPEAAAAAAAAAAAVEGDSSAAPATAAAAAGAPAAAAPFRLFVVARRVTAALVDRPADLASLLDAEAKPFIAARLRQLFDSPPTAKVRLFSSAARQLLSGATLPGSGAAAAIRPAHHERGQAAQHSWQLPAIPGSPAAPLLRRYSRLLVLEEAAMEADIRRHASLPAAPAGSAGAAFSAGTGCCHCCGSTAVVPLQWFHCCGCIVCPMPPPLPQVRLVQCAAEAGRLRGQYKAVQPGQPGTLVQQRLRGGRPASRAAAAGRPLPGTGPGAAAAWRRLGRQPRQALSPCTA